MIAGASALSGVEVRGLSRRFGPGTAALDGVDLAMPRGGFLALLGPSGSGKTTLLRILAGLETPDAGQVHLLGRDVSAVPARERGIGFVFQHYALFRHMSVFENVAFGLRVRPRRERPDEAEIAARVQEEAFDHLDAPIMRVTGRDVPMPYAANLEKLALPNVGDVVAAAKAVLYRS